MNCYIYDITLPKVYRDKRGFTLVCHFEVLFIETRQNVSIL